MLQTNTGSKVGSSHMLTDSQGAFKLKLQCELKSLMNKKCCLSDILCMHACMHVDLCPHVSYVKKCSYFLLYVY